MVKFDWGDFRELLKLDYNNEVENSKNIQDEVKVFNERFPSWLEPLYKIEEAMAEGSGDAVGEFNGGGIAGDSYEEQAWSFFLGQGFEKKAIAGIMGNLQQESGVNPEAIQNGGRGPGTGLIQWGNGHDGDRWGQLVKWANSQDRDEWDMHTQLDYLWKEMTDGSHDAYWHRAGQKVGRDMSGSGEEPAKKLAKVDDIEDAMKIFELTIERAGKKHYSLRMKYANNFYKKYKDWDPDMSAGGDGNFVVPFKTDYTVTSEFGYRIHPNEGIRKLHAGIDLSTGTPADIYPIANGKVVQNTYMGGGWGHYVVIDHGVIDGKQFYSLYAHMAQKGIPSVGDNVGPSKKIGTEGNTGNSKGRHLHLETIATTKGGPWSGAERTNPREFINF